MSFCVAFEKPAIVKKAGTYIRERKLLTNAPGFKRGHKGKASLEKPFSQCPPHDISSWAKNFVVIFHSDFCSLPSYVRPSSVLFRSSFSKFEQN